MSRFTNGYYYKELLKKHTLDEEGIWHIFGEDPNCDLGGYHKEPDLGFIEGRLEDVIKVAQKIKGFYSWGQGGRIVKHEPRIRNAKQILQGSDHLEKLQRKKKELELELEKINSEINRITP